MFVGKYFSADQKCKQMELFARAADCISRGDLVDKHIRQNMAWSLLPTQVTHELFRWLRKKKKIRRHNLIITPFSLFVVRSQNF